MYCNLRSIDQSYARLSWVIERRSRKEPHTRGSVDRHYKAVRSVKPREHLASDSQASISALCLLCLLIMRIWHGSVHLSTDSCHRLPSLRKGKDIRYEEIERWREYHECDRNALAVFIDELHILVIC